MQLVSLCEEEIAARELRQQGIVPVEKAIRTWIALKREMGMTTFEDAPSDSVAIVSGGLDSTTLVYDMIDKGYVPHLLSFNYGQRHRKELLFAKATASKFGLRHDVIDLTSVTHLISNSALTSGYSDLHKTVGNIEVPEGHYGEDSMKQTVVPNRNMIMLSIATGVAVNEKARLIGLGVHAGDHFVYPDCRPGFISAMETAISLGNEGFDSFERHEIEDAFGRRDVPGGGALYAPFLRKSKADIAYRALSLDVPLHETWSCYKGGDVHCGRCGTCVERLEAIDEAISRRELEIERVQDSTYGLPKRWHDETPYADTEFWKTQVGKVSAE